MDSINRVKTILKTDHHGTINTPKENKVGITSRSPSLHSLSEQQATAHTPERLHSAAYALTTTY